MTHSSLVWVKHAHLNVRLIVIVFESALLTGIQADWTQETNLSAPGTECSELTEIMHLVAVSFSHTCACDTF